MKRFFALLLVFIVFAAGHAWRSEDGPPHMSITLDSDDDGKDDEIDEAAAELKKSIQKDVVDEFKKEVDQTVAEFKADHPPPPPLPPLPPPGPDGKGADKNLWISVSNGGWEPVQSTVDEIRAGIEAYVQDGAHQRKLTLKEWPSYSFQYQGREADGRQSVYVNAYCTPPPADFPKEQLFAVKDGGPCYFQVQYDLQKRQFFDLRFNGAG